MDPIQLEDYLNRILGSLSAIVQNQEKQREDHSKLAQQVDSMSSTTSQNERLEETSSQTEVKNVNRPEVEGGSERTDPDWTSESQASSSPRAPHDLQVPLSQASCSMQDILTEMRALLAKQTDSMNSTLQDERYFLRDQLGNAQAEILERLGIFQQESTSLQYREGEDTEVDYVSAPTRVSSSTLEDFRSVCNEVLETTVRGVTRMELLWLEKEVKDKFSALENTVNDQLAGIDEKLMSLDKRWSGELDNKVREMKNELAKENKKSVTEMADRNLSQEHKLSGTLFDKIVEEIRATTKAISEVPARVINKQAEALARTTEELRDVMDKNSEQLNESQNANIQRCTQTVQDCQKRTEEQFQTSSHEIKMRPSYFGISVLLLFFSVCVYVCFSPVSTNHLAKMLEQHRYITENAMANALSETTEKIKAEISRVNNQIQEAQERQLKSCVEILTSDILKCSELMRDYHQKGTQDIKSGFSRVSELIREALVTQWEGQRENDRKIETRTAELSQMLYRLKLEMFYHVEKEHQLTRDYQQSPSRGLKRRNYMFDFYVDDFKTFVKSGKAVHSHLWHVGRFMSVQGKVLFFPNGDMEVALLFGRHPREVGLEPRFPVYLRVTATITDLSKTVADYRVGKRTDIWDENGILNNSDVGFIIGTISCQRLTELGFGSKEKVYWRGAILIRYQVGVF